MSSQPGNIAVMIVADHPIMRDGLRMAVTREADMEVVGEASNEVQALLELSRCAPTVVLLDLQHPHGVGRQVAQAVRSAAQGVPIVVLSTFPCDWADSQAASLDPLFAVSKTASSHEIIQALRAAAHP